MRADPFPRQKARTRGFTLGLPRSFAVAADGSRIAFLRSAAGDDPVNALWAFDVAEARERLVFDPRGADAGDPSDQERNRRERTREKAEGVVAYGPDLDLRSAAFALGKRLFVADLVDGKSRELAPAGPPSDPRPDPTGRRVAYVADRALHVVDLDGGADRVLAEEDDPAVSWGLAEFIAAEEMHRFRGHWWSPDGERIAAARVDENPVPEWHISSPVDPTVPSRSVRYPQAGTSNALVALSVLGLDGSRVDLDWDPESFPYLARVSWQAGHPLTLLVQSRDQRTTRILAVEGATGAMTLVREDHDPEWLEIVDGVPRWLPDGRLVFTADQGDTRRLFFDDEPVTPPGLQIHRVVDVGQDVVFVASEEPTEAHVFRASPGGEVERLTREPGMHAAAASADVVVLTSITPAAATPTTTVTKNGVSVATLVSFAERPVLAARPTLFHAGPRELRAALITPGGREPERPLPVLLHPYGGPHAAMVVKSELAFLEDQWFADQGFAVLVADGRGTPGRGPAWERAISRNVADVVLEDQVDALHAAARLFGFLDLSRVAIRGWSFGGFLAAIAVLRRPEVFHAAVAGAPVTDPRLYDTHYSERYWGHPYHDAEAYRRSSLIEEAAKLERPLLLIHGIADDNVFVANTLQLSRALMEAGRPHSFLPLSGVTHMTPQEQVTENLLLLQLQFLREALGIPDSDA